MHAENNMKVDCV